MKTSYTYDAQNRRLANLSTWISYSYGLSDAVISHKDFPTLEQFLGVSFHQDWMTESTDSESAIRRYLAGENSSVVKPIVEELERLLSLHLPEDKLRDVVLRDLGCYYEPGYKGQSMTEWLHSVRSFLATAGR